MANSHTSQLAHVPRSSALDRKERTHHVHMNSLQRRLPALTGLVVLSLAATLLTSIRPAAAASVLAPGQMLGPNQDLVSPGGQYVLSMQGDGNLVLYGPGHTARWSSRTNGIPGAYLVMQTDGNLVIYAPAARRSSPLAPIRTQAPAWKFKMMATRCCTHRVTARPGPLRPSRRRRFHGSTPGLARPRTRASANSPSRTHLAPAASTALHGPTGTPAASSSPTPLRPAAPLSSTTPAVPAM
jgi:hypothetical protein